MSSTKIYNFETESSYNYNDADIELVSGEAKLKIKDEEGLTFNEDFADDTGFVYDDTKAEFVAGAVQQIDQTPSDALTWVKYLENINLNANDGGDPTGTSVNGAAILNNKLDLNYDDIRYVQYDGPGIADFMVQTGSIKFKVTPNYNGGPPLTNRVWFASARQAGSKVNRISIQHNKTASSITVIIANLAGIDVVNQSFGTFNAVLGQEYEILVCFDLDVLGGTGDTRLYLDGIKKGVTNTTADNRDANTGIVRIGSGTVNESANDCSIRDVILYPTVQETGASYTPGYTLEDARFLASKVELPQFEYTRTGDIQAFTNFVTTEANAPKYIMNDLYYNSGWISSDGTYAQSNSKSEVLTNISTLPPSNTMDIDATFEENGIQMSVNDLTLTYTGQHYDETNPIISIANCCRFYAEEMLTFLNNDTIVGSDNITYIMIKNGTKYWWDANVLSLSNGTYAQSNVASEVITNITTLIDGNTQIGMDVFLHSDDGTTTPYLDTVTMTYDAGLEPPSRLPRLVDINGRIYGKSGPIEGLQIEIRAHQNGFNNPNDNVGGGVFQMYGFEHIGEPTLSDGFFSGQVYLQPDGEYWQFRIGSQRYKTQLIDKDANDLNELTMELVED